MCCVRSVGTKGKLLKGRSKVYDTATVIAYREGINYSGGISIHSGGINYSGGISIHSGGSKDSGGSIYSGGSIHSGGRI